jgi:hypothetical protein
MADEQKIETVEPTDDSCTRDGDGAVPIVIPPPPPPSE